jgi:hypothetical protein
MNKQTRNKTNKQTKKPPGLGTIEFQSWFKFWCYSSSIQSWCWYLSRSSVVVSLGGWVVVFFFFFQQQLLGPVLPSEAWQFRFACCLQVLESALWSTSCPVLEMGFCCACLLGACFFARSVICQLGQGQWSVSWPPAVSVLWWFAVCVSILQCHLTLDVAHWLRRWALWTATCPISGRGLSPTSCWPSYLSSHLFTDSSCGDQILCPSPFSGVLSEFLSPLLCASFQFFVYCSVFFFAGGG